jgi:2'-5' RNA ligase
LSDGDRAVEYKRRLFVGIALDEAARAGCAAAAGLLRATGYAAAYEDPAKFHVTLAFLGNVDAPRCDTAVEALGQTVTDRGAFVVTLDKLGAFPHERKPRVVYAGAREQGSRFRALAHAVAQAYRKCGFEFADDPIAHVTLARVKGSPRALPMLEIAPISLRCARVCLFESIFDKEKNTSRYEVFAQERLAVSGA